MAALMGVVALLAVGMAALKSANQIWVDVITTLVLSIMLFAVLGVLNTTGPMRRFWSGFAVFGWACLIFGYGDWFKDCVPGYFPTTRLLEWLYYNIATDELLPIDSRKIVVLAKPDGTYLVDGEEVADDTDLIELIAKLSPSKSNSKAIKLYFDRETNQKTIADETKRLSSLLLPVGISNFEVRELRLSPHADNFSRIGQYFIALLAGIIGGSLTRFVFRRPEERTAEAGGGEMK